MLFVDPQRLERLVVKRPDDGQIVLTGAGPWPPRPDGRPCPVCGYGVHGGDEGTVCGWCCSTSPACEVRLTGERLRASRYLLDEKGVSHQESELVRFFEERKGKLSERQRRRIWMGCRAWRGGSATTKPVDYWNVAWLGRRFLRFTKQEPDWNVVLEDDGKPVKARSRKGVVMS